MIRSLLGLIFNRWVAALLGLTALGLLIWYVGPLIAVADYRPLESERMRTGLIALIVLIWLVKLIWRWASARQSNAKLMSALATPVSTAQRPQDSAAAQELATLQKRFEDAVTLLKQSKSGGSGLRTLLPGRQYLYELPWFVFIGAPGSGKTTALVNSGLQFPLAERFGQQKIRGIGGTRNCDWWFTNDAVFLDTAGRYTTQESNQESDHAAWTGFLQLLKKYRPRRPINGVIVTVSVADLLQQSAGELDTQAAALRSRLEELHKELGIRFPVYVLVTKTDLLPGFMEFFGEYGREERAQVWGFSAPVQERLSAELPDLHAEMNALEQRLNERLVDRLQQERDLQKRALIYEFPQQFSALKETLADFLQRAFEPSRFEVQPMIRGVYFTSGTQEGSPIDRMMGQLARALHLDQKLLPPNRPSDKAYFITRFIKEIVLAEAGLAGTNLKWERQRVAIQWAALAAVGLITVGAIAAWTISYANNKAYVDAVAAKLQAVSRQVGQLQARPTPDVIGLVPTLDAVRDLALASGLQSDDAPLSMGFGLYQGRKLATAANAAYRRLLQDAFLPRLQARLEQLLRTRGQQNPELLYEGLKAYVMLSDAQHFDAEAVKAFITADWETSLPREVTTDQRKDLASHLDALLSQGAIASPILPDNPLIASARENLARTPIPQRIYNRLLRQGIGAALPEFTIAAAGGPSAPLVFTRESGQPLTKGVPGLFSFDGYYKTFIPAAEQVTQEMADEEPWVLGVPAHDRGRFLDPARRAGLTREVRRLYLEDYAHDWERYVADVKVIRAGSLQQAIQTARILSSPDSPLPLLLRAVVKEVTLVKTDEPAQKDIIDKATDQVKKRRDELLKRFGQQAPVDAGSPGGRLESIVDDRFTALRRLVKSPTPGQPAPIDQTVVLISDLYTHLTAADAAIRGGSPPPPSEVPLKIKAEAGRLPEPVRSMLSTLSQAGVTEALGATRENLSKAIVSGLSDFCQRATNGRYPFVKASTQDVTQDDFARLFAPGGLFDEFFQKNLVAFVDTSTRPWKFRQIGDSVMGTSTATLLQFQRAQTIRDVFFRAGKGPALRLEFKPVEMDATITQFILDVDGQLVKYSHGPQVPTTVQWPGSKGSMQVRLQLSPPSPSGASGQVFEGPWALFRLLDGAAIERTSQAEKFMVTFDVEGRKARFEVLTTSVENPFRLQDLDQFRCPDRL